MQDANEYNCNICEKTFKHKHTLFTHKRTHNTSRSRCDECGRDVKSISLVIHKRMHISKSFSFECSICGEILKTKATLKMHVITLHNLELPNHLGSVLLVISTRIKRGSRAQMIGPLPPPEYG